MEEKILSYIILNEDSTNFFCTHPAEDMNAEGLDAWVDQYADTQVRELVFNTNAQRSSFDAKAKQPLWYGFDPDADNNQPYFSGITKKGPWASVEAAREHSRRWASQTLLLHQQGLDPYACWIKRSRVHGISPWMSMRMNDVHWVTEPEHPIHDRFWKEHPEYRRAPWQSSWHGQCLDYGRPEVRDYQMAYVRELIARYDMDGLELDWMRFGAHFRPGHEEEGCELLTEFTADVRGLLDDREQELGHPVPLSARVPSCPEATHGLGMDAVSWARKGLIDRLVVTPFLHTENDMPIEIWQQLLDGSDVTLIAGLYPSLRLFVGGERMSVTPESTRGLAITQLDRGSEMIYLFNFMDHSSTPEGREAYQLVLKEIGSPQTMIGKSRRHILTPRDYWAPGEVQAFALPSDLAAGDSREFRIPIGPAPSKKQAMQVRLELAEKETDADEALEVRVNSEICTWAGEVAPSPGTTQPTCAFAVPADVGRRGHNVVEVHNTSSEAVRLTWMELTISDAAGVFPESGIETQLLYPK